MIATGAIQNYQDHTSTPWLMRDITYHQLKFGHPVYKLQLPTLSGSHLDALVNARYYLSSAEIWASCI